MLEVNNLKTYFFARRGVLKAVDGVSFTLRDQETLGLVGESGSGKTMTALSLVRLVPPPGRIVEGSVKVDGTELLTLSDRQMRSVRGRVISMITQDPLSSLNPVLKIGDQVGEAMPEEKRRDRSAVRERVVSLLRQVGIAAPETRLRQYPHQFSGGMRQRVVGAIALASEPKILVADEPTTSLDVTVQEQFLALLRKIKEEERLSIVFVTHDFGIVAKMCDRVAVMYAGRIVEQGDVRDIFKRPAHPYTKALLASVPSTKKSVNRLPSIPGQPPSVLNRPSGCPFRTRCSVVFGKCTEEPPEVTLPTGQSVRCWHYC